MKTALLMLPSTNNDVNRYNYLQVCIQKVHEEDCIPFTPSVYENIFSINEAEFINKVLYRVDYVYMFIDFGMDQAMLDVIDRSVAAQIEIRYKMILITDYDKLFTDPHLVLLDVCRKTGIKPEDLKGKDRHRHITEARQIYCRRAKEKTRASLQSIGNEINKDHATVLYSIRVATEVKVVSDIYDKHYGTTRIKAETMEAKTAAEDNRHCFPVERPVLPFRSMDPREQNIPTGAAALCQMPGKRFYYGFGGH
jgi:hypothetical protein